MRHDRRALTRDLRDRLERAAHWPCWGHWATPLAAAVVTGAVSRNIWAALSIALIAYLIGEAAQLWRLRRWLDSPQRMKPPPLKGISGHLAQRIDAMRQRLQHRLDRRGSFLKDMRFFVSRLPNAVILLDKDHRVEWSNRQAEHLLGIRWPGDAGLLITHLLRHPDVAQALRHLYDGEFGLRLTMMRQTETTLDFQFITRADRRTVIFVRDISKAVRQERVRQDFIANASHELRTPLTVLSGITELLLDERSEAPGGWLPKLKMIDTQVGYMRELTDDLLRLSMLEHTRNPTDADDIIDMTDLCRSAADEMEDLASGQQLQLHVECRSRQTLRGQKPSIHRTLINLISNAIRHTEPGGRIIVRWLADANGARLEVEDNGSGIAARHIPRLTERFYRVDQGRDRNAGGSGLGLAIVRHVLDGHQATLQIDSAPGEGSRFTCLFPPDRLN